VETRAKTKLFDSELKVMEALWRAGDMTAGQLATALNEQTGWNRNTTYTVIKKLIDKQAVERREPNFTCHALINREQIQKQEAQELIGKLFDGSAETFLCAYFGGKTLTPNEIERLRQIVDSLA
jgi:predicted transcriptional regulator